MGLLLITEQVDDVQILTEESEGKKSHYIHGVFMQGNVQNRNKRSYPTEVLARECARYNRDFIRESRGLGELGHPEGPTVNLDRASHKFEDLHQDGHNFIGRAKILDNLPMGKIAAGLLDEGVKLGVSTRGMGSLRNGVVQDDFFLATPGDIVHDPSAPNAFVNGIYEGKEWVWENGILKEHVIAEIKRDLDKVPSNRLEEGRIKAFSDFMNKISGRR